MANILAQRVEEVLRPVVGSVLATVSVDLEAKRLGKTSDTLERGDLPALAENLKGQLTLVVGAELAQAAASRVHLLL